jgi:hypothetical protein
MAITETKASPAPPNIITAFRGGFDAIANRVYLILVPVLFDLWLWLGPHLQIKRLIENFWISLNEMPGFDPSQSGGLIPTDPSEFQAAIERINLMTLLRSYPIGIPSLVSGVLPIEAPIRGMIFVEVTSPLIVGGVWLLFTLIGIMVGTFYYILISQAAITGKVVWRKAFADWPRKIPQVILLSIATAVILMILLIPASCILSFVSMGGIPISQLAIVILGGMLLWILFPLAFTPHGIFALGLNLLTAIQRSVMLTRMTMPTTALFILIVLILGQGLDVLWRVPAENSWFTLIGLAGHGFVASAMLAATFVYYRDADLWAQNIIRKIRLSGSA